MLLEDAIEKHRSAMGLLNSFRSPDKEKNQEDDIFVRPYIVRAHWRIRVIRRRRGRGSDNHASA